MQVDLTEHGGHVDLTEHVQVDLTEHVVQVDLPEHGGSLV